MKWWSNRSDPERFDLYTRWSLYALFAVVPLGIMSLGVNSPAGRGTILALVIISIVQVGVGIAALSKGITHCLGGPRPSTAVVVVLAGLSVAGVAVALTVPGVSFTGDEGSGIWLPYLFAIVGIAAVSPMFSNRQLLVGSAGLAAAVGGLAWWQGADPTQSVGAAVGIGVSSISVTLAFRISVRMLKVVWEIERSRTVEAALAVAEERLRFSRDLHDVLGRNLSVIAVKSELASELVRRSRPEAATEIAEVNRIAQESLREVRAVVRGYRQADFATELAGARGILAAAGIGCQVDGDPTMLPVDSQKTMGWVVREATTNVLRHSRAAICTITINVIDGVAVLTVVNDGVHDGELHAADPAANSADSPGSGLAGLEERLLSLGGALEAGPVDGARFRVTASIPLQHKATRVDQANSTAVADPATLAVEQR